MCNILEIFEGGKGGQATSEYLIMLATVLGIVAIVLSLMMDLDPNFDVTGHPRVTDYGPDGVSVNLANVSVAPSDAVIQEISIVVNGNEETLVSFDNSIHFSDLESYLYKTGVGATDRDKIGVVIITSDEGTASVPPIIN